MKKFAENPRINIAGPQGNPFLIDPSDVTCIRYYTSQDILVINDSRGVVATVESASLNNIDVAQVFEKLKEYGVDLLPLPARENGIEYPCYVAPAAVAYATMSECSAQGNMNAIVGIRGAGRWEAYNVTRNEVNSLMSAVTALKPGLVFGAEEAHSRWVKPQSLYIDPSSVTRIHDSGGKQVDVFFDQTGRLDIQVGESMEPFMMIRDRLLKTASAADDLNEIFNKAVDISHQQDKNAAVERRALIARIAEKNDDLVFIPSHDSGVFLRRKDVDRVFYRDNDSSGMMLMGVLFKVEKQGDYQEPLWMYFKTDTARDAAVSLLGLPLPPAQQTKKPPSPPH